MKGFAIIGTGGMANGHARELQQMRGIKLLAACDVLPEKAREFAEKYGIPRHTDDLDEVLSDDRIDAVHIVTPDPYHCPIALRAIKAGKHVLCEKPLAVNHPDAAKMARAAERQGILHMVNFSYRGAAAIQRAAQIVARGDLGEIKHFDAHYLQSWLSVPIWGEWRTSPQWLWRLSTEHGSKGALGDTGVHLLDFAGFPLGEYARVHCTLKTFPKAPGERIGKYTLDANDSAIISAEMKNGALGSLSITRYATGYVNNLQLRLHGIEGGLRIDLDRSWEELEVCTGKNRLKPEWRTIRCKPAPSVIKRFARSVIKGEPDQPDFHTGASVQKVLDACFASGKDGQPRIL